MSKHSKLRWVSGKRAQRWKEGCSVLLRWRAANGDYAYQVILWFHPYLLSTYDMPRCEYVKLEEAK